MENEYLQLRLTVPGETRAVLKIYGFDEPKYFFRQCAAAIIRAHKADKKLDWPLEFVTYDR
jgi:hypothetical protein